MIAALIVILFLGGGIEDAVLDYAKYAKGAVKEVVVDDERRSAAVATLKEIQKLTKAQSRSNKQAFKSLLRMASDLDVDADAADALWEDYYLSVDSYNKRIIDLRFELRDSLTREEWNAVFPAGDDQGA